MANRKAHKKLKARFGELPPRYKLFLNPYQEYRFTTCPQCNQLTKWRKFALMIHIDPAVLISLNMHCRFCPACEMLIVHQDQLEAELAEHMSAHNPAVIGNDYFLIGTLERAAWRQGMQRPVSIDEMLKNVADFEDYIQVEVRPAGWYPAEE